VADTAAISFAAPNGQLNLYSLNCGVIRGFAAGDTIVLIALATGLSYAQTTSNTGTLTLLNAGAVVGTLTLSGNYASNLFHLRIDGHGNDFITMQLVGSAPVQPTLIVGSVGQDVLTATANNQTLTGLGGNDSLDGGALTGIVFKDTSANLNGSTITSFSGTSAIDLTDMASNRVTGTSAQSVYTAGVLTTPASLTLTDGTHTATIYFSPSTPLPHGYWSINADGATGTNLKLIVLNTDAFTYTPALGGSMATVSSWLDVTAGAAATQLPGYGNGITLAGGTLYMNLLATASVASLTTSGSVLLLGTISVGTVIPGFSGALSQSGMLALDNGATLALAGGAAIGGTIQVASGGKLTVAGTATFISPNTALLAINGGKMQFGGIDTITGPTYVPILYSPSVISVDASSSIEFGTTGGAATGALTIDNGVTAIIGGAIDGNVVVNGTLVTGSGGLAIGSFASAASSMTGSGTLQIAAGGTLTLGGSDTASIAFAASGGGTLILAATLPAGSIGVFAPGDAIRVALMVTTVNYVQTGSNAGVLTLLNGTATVGTLTFAGTYASQQFQVQCAAGSQSSTITYSPTPSLTIGSQVSSTSDTFAWINTSGGSWTNAGNWTDTTSNRTAATAPGVGTAVVIQDNPGAMTSQIVSGSGIAASLSIYGAASTVFTGNLSVAGQFYLGAGAASGVALQRNAQFNVGSLFDYASLRIVGGSALAVTGASGGTEIVGSLNLLGGGGMQALGWFDIGGGIVGVDTLSILEIGAAGGAAQGRMTIDAGQLVTMEEYGTIAATLTVNGTLVVANGTIEGFGGTTGSVGGTGTIQIGGLSGAGKLTLNAPCNAALLFAPPNPSNGSIGSAVLESVGSVPTGKILGFAAGDTIQIDQTVTGIRIQGATTSLTTVILTNGAATVGTLTLVGDYTHNLIHLDVAPASGVATLSLQTATTNAGTSAVSAGTDAFNWTGVAGGSWSNAANWIDQTTGTTPNQVAGSRDAVVIAGSAGTQTTIGGNGAAASLSVSGNVLLTGQITAAGQLAVAPALGQPAALALDAGARLTVGSAALAGTLEVNASAANIGGTASLAGAALLSLNGGFVQVGGLIGNGSNIIAVDATSALTIGTPTTAAAGTLTQAAGTTVALTGSIEGNVVTSGILSVPGGGSLFIDMTGSVASDPYATAPTIGGTGTLAISEGGTLGLGAVSNNIIQMNGANATLILAVLPTFLIRGFGTGDTIQIDQAVTGVNYTQITTNQALLTLTNGAATVGSFRLAGQYQGGGNLFHLDVAPDGSSATITLQTLGIAAAQPNLIQGTAASDLLSATANGQTLSGLGGIDTMSGGGFTSTAFRDLTANMNGDTIQGFAISDCFDFTDLKASGATVSYINGNLSVTDGTHAATLGVGFVSYPSTGMFHVASDGASGTNVTWY
jgi:hypothetical protein